MATDGTSSSATTDSGSASETPSMDDLSPAQIQWLLKAALQQFQEVEEAVPPIRGQPLVGSGEPTSRAKV